VGDGVVCLGPQRQSMKEMAHKIDEESESLVYGYSRCRGELKEIGGLSWQV